MEKAKERLKGLLAILRQGSYEDDEESSYCLDDDDLFRISSECIVLYRGLYGEDDWSSADMFWAHFHIASAFGRQDRKQQAIELLELAMAKLKMQQKFKGWSVLVREMSMKLAANYFCQNGRFLEAQPLCEVVYEKYYQQLPEETKLWLRYSLIVCYKYTRSWKKARELVERACKENKQVYGHENAGGYEFLGLRDKIFRSSYNTAHTFGVDGILDGTIVEIDSYDNFGYFHASVLCENSCDDDYSCGYNQRLAVPVDEVIMLPDSDIALHSLNGSEWKIGCRGRFQQRNRAIRRHSRGKRKDCQRQASKCPPGLHGVREGENGCSCKGAIQPR
jgi:tetratricopeptide (TPR) repeat protein